MEKHSTGANDAGTPAALTGWRAILRDLAQMVRFYSRLPAPKLPFEADAHAPPDFSTAPRMLPLAGLIIGLPGAITLWLADWVGLPSLMAAGLGIAVAIFASGAFHEDGLADTFDGLGGGWTVERKLEIMRDSRIGSFGGAALILGIGLRFAALSALVEEAGAMPAALAMLMAASLSRTIALTPLVILPTARPDGLSAALNRLTPAITLVAAALTLLIAALLTWLSVLPFWGAALGIILALAVTLAISGWSWRAIKGQTGDIAGACQQLAEIAFYAGLLISLSHV